MQVQLFLVALSVTCCVRLNAAIPPVVATPSTVPVHQAMFAVHSVYLGSTSIPQCQLLPRLTSSARPTVSSEPTSVVSKHFMTHPPRVALLPLEMKAGGSFSSWVKKAAGRFGRGPFSRTAKNKDEVDDLLNSEAFLNKKVEMLQKQIKTTQGEIQEAEREAEKQWKEWGPQVSHETLNAMGTGYCSAGDACMAFRCARFVQMIRQFF